MPKLATDIRSLCRAQTAMGVRVLTQIATDPEEPAGARVNAVVELFNRGWGRADVVHTGADGGPIRVVIRQVLDITGETEAEPLVIEHDRDR